jgi:prepilin-type N-terminal cleavage/methylation domain-containing protein
MKTKVVAKDEKGFTLLELIISMIVFLIAVAAIFGAMRIAGMQKSTNNDRIDQMRSARIALEYMRRDTMNAGSGYHRIGGLVPDGFGVSRFGFQPDSDSERDFLVSIFGADDLTNNVLNPAKKMDLIGFVSRDYTFNGGKPIEYQKRDSSGSDVYVETTVAGAAANCAVNDLYLIEPKDTSQLIGMATAVSGGNTITLAVNDPFGVNQAANASDPNLQNLLMPSLGKGMIKKINLVTYGITAEGVLVRKSYGNRGTAANQIEERELVYGVTDFQIKYFMEDGTTLDNPSSNNNGRDNQQKMNSVVQVQISVTIIPVTKDGLENPVAPVTLKEFISTKNLRYSSSRD